MVCQTAVMSVCQQGNQCWHVLIGSVAQQNVPFWHTQVLNLTVQCVTVAHSVLIWHTSFIQTAHLFFLCTLVLVSAAQPSQVTPPLSLVSPPQQQSVVSGPPLAWYCSQFNISCFIADRLLKPILAVICNWFTIRGGPFSKKGLHLVSKIGSLGLHLIDGAGGGAS